MLLWKFRVHPDDSEPGVILVQVKKKEAVLVVSLEMENMDVGYTARA